MISPGALFQRRSGSARADRHPRRSISVPSAIAPGRGGTRAAGAPQGRALYPLPARLLSDYGDASHGPGHADKRPRGPARGHGLDRLPGAQARRVRPRLARDAGGPRLHDPPRALGRDDPGRHARGAQRPRPAPLRRRRRLHRRERLPRRLRAPRGLPLPGPPPRRRRRPLQSRHRPDLRRLRLRGGVPDHRPADRRVRRLRRAVPGLLPRLPRGLRPARDGAPRPRAAPSSRPASRRASPSSSPRSPTPRSGSGS